MRNLPAIIAVCVLIIVVALHFHYSHSMKEKRGQLAANINHLRDSLNYLSKVVDSLKAQTPGLGEYMSTIQLHAAKLWFAGKANNWELAKFEYDELKESVGAAEQLHAKRNNLDITSILDSVQETQFSSFEDAIAKSSGSAFTDAYTKTLAACNNCHKLTGYNFIHIVTPKGEPVVNQEWKKK